MSRWQSVSQLRIEIWRRAVFRNETWRCCRASLRKIIGKNFLLWSSSNLPIFIHVSWLISNHYARRRHISTPSWDTEHYLPIMFPHHHQSSSNSKIKECKKKRREKLTWKACCQPTRLKGSWSFHIPCWPICKWILDVQMKEFSATEDSPGGRATHAATLPTRAHFARQCIPASSSTWEQKESSAHQALSAVLDTLGGLWSTLTCLFTSLRIEEAKEPSRKKSLYWEPIFAFYT